MRLWSPQWFGNAVSANTDAVQAAFDLPPEAILNGMEGHISIYGNGSDYRVSEPFDLAGVIVPSPDPEGSTTYDDVWHDFVEKSSDASVSAIRLDESPNDTTPIWEPGELRWGDMANISIVEDEDMFYKYRDEMSFAKRPTGWAAGSPDTYVPTDYIKMNTAKKRWKVFQASHACFAVSSPNFDDIAATLRLPAENTREWMWIKYAKEMMEFAFKYSMSMTDGAGDDPWELATLFMEEVMAPPIYTPAGAAALFQGDGLTVVGKVTWDVTVPGEHQINSVSGGA